MKTNQYSLGDIESFADNLPPKHVSVKKQKQKTSRYRYLSSLLAILVVSSLIVTGGLLSVYMQVKTNITVENNPYVYMDDEPSNTPPYIIETAYSVNPGDTWNERHNLTNTRAGTYYIFNLSAIVEEGISIHFLNATLQPCTQIRVDYQQVEDFYIVFEVSFLAEEGSYNTTVNVVPTSMGNL